MKNTFVGVKSVKFCIKYPWVSYKFHTSLKKFNIPISVSLNNAPDILENVEGRLSPW